MKTENLKLKIIFFGSPRLVVSVLKTLCNNFEVIGVVSAPDKPVGRKQTLTPSAISTAYLSYLANPDHERNLLTPGKIDDEFINEIQNLNPDLFVVAAYGGILPQSLLSIPKLGAINIHPSLLPKYRGASPIQSAILSGDSTTGVTFIKMDEQMDHGPIIYQFEEHINSSDTFETLGNRLFEMSAEKLPEIINGFISNQKAEPQNEKEATLCKILTKQDGFIDLENPPSKELFERMTRAYYPWPGVWTKFSDKIIKFYPFETIQMEGKNPVPASTFINGYPELEEYLKKLGFA